MCCAIRSCDYPYVQNVNTVCGYYHGYTKIYVDYRHTVGICLNQTCGDGSICCNQSYTQWW